MKEQAEIQEESLNVEIYSIKEVIEWQQDYQNALELVPKLSMKRQQKDQFLIRSWGEEYKSVTIGIKEISRIIHGLWDSSSNILSRCGL